MMKISGKKKPRWGEPTGVFAGRLTAFRTRFEKLMHRDGDREITHVVGNEHFGSHGGV